MRAHAPIARAGLDPEGVHQVRVAGGRLDVFLRLAGQRVLRDDLRWMRSRAASVRDFDVLLARELDPRFKEWLASERVVARAGLLECLESARFSALDAALDWLPPIARGAARERRDELARRARSLARDALERDASLESFHRARRAVRRLRYADEWLERDAEQAKRAQGRLGELNDAAVASALFDEFPARAELAELGRELDRDLETRRESARRALRHFTRRRKEG